MPHYHCNMAVTHYTTVPSHLLSSLRDMNRLQTWKEQKNGNENSDNPDIKLDTKENDNTIDDSIQEVMFLMTQLSDIQDQLEETSQVNHVNMKMSDNDVNQLPTEFPVAAWHVTYISWYNKLCISWWRCTQCETDENICKDSHDKGGHWIHRDQLHSFNLPTDSVSVIVVVLYLKQEMHNITYTHYMTLCPLPDIPERKHVYNTYSRSKKVQWLNFMLMYFHIYGSNTFW